MNKKNSAKIVIGKVNSAFGIKGEVKIISYCQNPIQIEKYPLFDEKNNPLKLKISNKSKTVIGTTSAGAILIAKIDGVNDRNESEKLCGKEIFTIRDVFAELDEDEFYYSDLIDLDVIDENSKKIGKVVNVQDFGAGGMIEIEFEQEDKKNNLEKIENFPFKNEFFPEVNLQAGFIKINIPEIVESR